MTKAQKMQIIGLRNSGMSCKDIANLIDIPAPTISNYYNRHKPDFNHSENHACRQCGKSITGHRKFCSDECCRTWWKEHPEAKNMGTGAIYTFTCAGCGKTFTSYGNSHRKYCSHQCYIKARFYQEGK